MSDDLYYMSAADAGRKIAAKDLSSAELTEALLDRTAAIDGKLNAYIEVLGDQARADAKAADAAVAKGEVKGPLHGVPVAHGVVDSVDDHARNRVADGVADGDPSLRIGAVRREERVLV